MVLSPHSQEVHTVLLAQLRLKEVWCCCAGEKKEEQADVRQCGRLLCVSS